MLCSSRAISGLQLAYKVLQKKTTYSWMKGTACPLPFISYLLEALISDWMEKSGD